MVLTTAVIEQSVKAHRPFVSSFLLKADNQIPLLGYMTLFGRNSVASAKRILPISRDARKISLSMLLD